MTSHDPLIESGVDYVHIVIGRDAIETGDLAGPLESLRTLTASRERVLRFRERVDLTIDGYTDDPRELYEVREVREYVASLDAAFPYWFWFLDSGTSGLLIIAASCCDFRAVREAKVRRVEIDPTALVHFAMRHFDALNRLADVHDIPPAALEEISESIGTWLAGA